MTTENVTVLFTDLVGSTQLASSLTPEAGDELRRSHFRILRKAIAAYGGTEVKNLGDGLMIVFATASAALSCAVSMQQSVDLDNRGLGRTLGLRVGLSAGEATREGDDYFGDPVIESARLCAAASGGQILTSSVVSAIAGRRSPHAFAPLGALELKGLPVPVETLEVSWQPLDDIGGQAGEIPLPARFEITPAIGVIGRASESTLLADAFKRVAAYEGREVALVCGEAGVGKTTLVTQAARTAHQTGAVVLLGRCHEDLGLPYGPFTESITHYVNHAPEEVLRSHVRSHGGALGTIAPALRQRLGELPAPQSSDPDTERYLLYGAVVGLLAQEAEHRPVLLVLDDLQWADTPSLQLFRHVVANTSHLPILFLGTYRDSELSGSLPLADTLVGLQRESGVSRIELTGLDDTSVFAYVEATAGSDIGEAGAELAHALYRETDGNPFFVGEMLRHLADTGAVYQDSTGHWTSDLQLEDITLPNSVREVIMARVARLGEPAGRIFSLACVIGRDFDLDLLGLVSGCGEDELLDLMDAAATGALVREVDGVPGRYSFAHALVQHTLYQRQSAARRGRAHHQVATAIEDMYGAHSRSRVSELAHHWCNAPQPANAAKAIEYSRQAGEAALQSLAPDDAVRHFTQALALTDVLPEHDPLMDCDLRIELGEAQRQAGLAAFRETFLQAAAEARDLGATDRLVRAALSNNRGFVSMIGSIDADRVAVLEAALDALPAGDSRERALVLATLCSEITYGSSLEQRRTIADEARAMADRLSDPVTSIRVLNLVFSPLQVPSLQAEQTADVKKALFLAELLGDPDLQYGPAYHARYNAIHAADFESAARHLATMRSLSDLLRQPTLMWTTAVSEATEALLVGEPDRAEQLAAAALQMGTDSGQPDAATWYGGQVGVVLAQRGRQAELVPLFEQLVDENPGVGSFNQGLAMAYLDAGEDGRALALLEAAAADEFASFPQDLVWIFGITAYADVAVHLRATGPARILFELLAPFHDRVPIIAPAAVPPVAFYLGGLATVLGRYDDAEAFFREAMDVNTRGRMKYSMVRTEIAWGRMMCARNGPGDRDRARVLFEQAAAAAATHGYAGEERQAATELSTWT